jgi:UDP-glucose 4-epimerase
LNWFVRQAMEGRAITVYGDGSQRREYIYVDDVVRALLVAGVHPDVVGRAFNVSSGVPVSFREMVEQVVRAAGSGSVQCVPWPPDRKQIEVGDALMDSSRLTAATGWRPEVALTEGLGRTVAFYREHRRHYWEATS